MDRIAFAQKISLLADKVALGSKEPLELVPEGGKTPSKKEISKAWPNLTYKGDTIHPMKSGNLYEKWQDKAEDKLRDDEGIDSFQEVYLGYDPKKDLFVMGWDLWPGEEEYDEDDEYGEDEDGYGRYSSEGPRKAAVKKQANDMGYALATIKDGRVKSVEDYWPGGGFYRHGLKIVHSHYNGILDLRLD